MGERPADLPENIGAPATRALLGAGHTGLDQLDGVPVSGLSSRHGGGGRALRVLQEALGQRGLTLG